MPFEDLAGQSVHGHIGRLADLNVDNVGLVHLHLGGDDAHVRQGHQNRALVALDAFHHRFALADGQVGHDGVKGSHGGCQIERILVGTQGSHLHFQVPAQRIGLRLGLIQRCHSLIQRGDIGVVGRFFGVEIRFGHDAGVVKGLLALPIQPLLLQISFGLGDIGFGSSFRGNIGVNVGFGGGDGGLLAGDSRLLLHMLDAGYRLARLHHVSLFYKEVGDAAEGSSAQIGIRSGLDLAGAADHRNQVLARDFGGENLGVAGLLPVDEQGHKPNGGHSGKNQQNYLFHARYVLRVSLIVYATGAGAVLNSRPNAAFSVVCAGCRRVRRKRMSFPQGLSRLRKNSGFRVKLTGKCPSGAKARVNFAGFMRGLKPPPPSE